MAFTGLSSIVMTSCACDDMDLLTLISHFVQLCLDHILLTNDINIIFDQFCRLYGAFYHFMRGIISTHAV